jgi:hypothetical protein
MESAIARLMSPCPEAWIAARVLSLLSQYYDRDIPGPVKEMEARDWIAELAGHPQWAIDRACRWWGSADNPYRHRRPLHGDIVARCNVETAEPRVALSFFDWAGKQEAKPYREPIDDASRQRIADEVKALVAKWRAVGHGGNSGM